jgi:hypothetical protein
MRRDEINADMGMVLLFDRLGRSDESELKFTARQLLY